MLVSRHFLSPAASHPPSGKASYVSQVCCPLPCLVDYSFLLQAAIYNMKPSLVHHFKAFITTIYIFLKVINRLKKDTSCKCAECDYVSGMRLSLTSAAKRNKSIPFYSKKPTTSTSFSNLFILE